MATIVILFSKQNLNVTNTVSILVWFVCLLEWNISVTVYFDLPFYTVLELPANIYIYIITIILTLTNELNREVWKEILVNLSK